ncbi:protein DpdE [Streptomyces hainanensis]|uniref:Restriction endonuclease subunit R n=1 Tax=Streptomyces hainanensis TaxID=402648 RepID=A0A4R4TY74_9ACTN|nr:protein DpdE [Streptomyces hainanensis]TDC79149.1 restriction endonuclease subunit R [Streptomyces hainanensis]
MTGLHAGNIVVFAGGPGMGHVGGVDRDRVRVDFFESTAEPVADSMWVPTADCRRIRLESETRVYWRNPDTGAWLAGRVKGPTGGGYFVQFPNTKYDFPIPEDQLRVRWDRPVENPVTVLAAGGSESAYRDARLPMLNDLIHQRAACASAFALLSSAAEVYPHQVNGALRILSDPVRRYLLADEVGLGKTIQAGYVIRQTLIDEPRSSIAVLVPEALRHQWKRELVEKFFIDDFPGARVQVLTHEAPERWAAHLHCDLVVVDEAHQLVQVRDPDESPYRELCAVAHSASGLLLLSATPVTSHYTTHLGLLHLLDPKLYRWTDQAAFQVRYELRATLADHVYGLDSEYTYLLPTSIEQIRAILPTGDQRFAELSEQVLSLLDENDELAEAVDGRELARRVEALRAHISEVYRLHRRVIRNRRNRVLSSASDSEMLPFEVRGRRKPECLHVRSGIRDETHAAVLAWWEAVRDALLDSGSGDQQSAYAPILAVLTSRSGGTHDDLVAALRYRIVRDEEAARTAGLSAWERQALAGPPLLATEQAVLERLRHSQGDGENSKSALDALINAALPVFKAHQRTVVFCGPGGLAAHLADTLRARFPNADVGEHTHQAGSRAADRALSDWSSASRGQRAVLVADDSAEDGLNLQLADAVVHLRLPWSPNQFEQRLGRVDRYRGAASASQSSPARQFRLSGEEGGEDTFTDAWAAMLQHGYGIFDDSVSTLQDAIAEGLPSVWTRAFEEGPEGLAAATVQVQAELRTAREAIDKMDLLESIHEASLDSRDIAHSLDSYEQNWRVTKRAVERYTSTDQGGIKLRRQTRTVRSCERLEFGLADSLPLIDPRHWQHIRRRVTPEMAVGTFNRSAALRAPGTRLFRRGNPLIDAFASAVFVDDRGQAAALRRLDRALVGDPVPYFGFQYLVEADIGPALALVDNPGARHALRRHADTILPPFTRSVWLAAHADTPITDAAQLDWLNRPYDKRTGDFNYNKDRVGELIGLFGGWDAYRLAAEAAAEAARCRLAATTDMERRCKEAEHHARQRLAVARAQALARQAAGHLVGDAESQLTDVGVTERLIDGLTHPTVRVVAAVCLVRAGLERVRHGS